MLALSAWQKTAGAFLLLGVVARRGAMGREQRMRLQSESVDVANLRLHPFPVLEECKKNTRKGPTGGRSGEIHKHLGLAVAKLPFLGDGEMFLRTLPGEWREA